MKEYPSQEYLNSILEYRNGELYWKKRGKGIIQGKRAGNQNPNGYRNIEIDQSVYTENRIVYIMFNGDIPDGMQIDHINMIRNDNRIENLRALTPSQNKLNNCKTNVYMRFKNANEKRKPWRAIVMIDGKGIEKYFFTESEGIEWANEMKKALVST